ncbi:MAG TPA: gliding motility-associated C-terminal domain-containing protein, partial [Saprospiraceae bacterium]|nr:gliding motility-associated C-terminal domain-containing protein [Saprospiraceae bacterium]
MKYLPKYILTLFLLMGSIFHASATHIRAGEIVIQQLDDCGLTIKAVVLTYAKASMNAADEDTIIIDWGDGLFSSAGRVNGPGNKGEFIGNDIKLNRYEAFHTYSGRATYVISTTDHNRNAGIINIPNSVFIPMHISTTYTFLNPQFQGCNSTPVILQPPIDFGC